MVHAQCTYFSDATVSLFRCRKIQQSIRYTTTTNGDRRFTCVRKTTYRYFQIGGSTSFENKKMFEIFFRKTLQHVRLIKIMLYKRVLLKVRKTFTVTPLGSVEANSGARARDRASGKALEGMTDRQIISPLYDDLHLHLHLSIYKAHRQRV